MQTVPILARRKKKTNMKTIIRYDCEICGNRHHEAADALACEAKGYAEEYPRGLIHGSTKGFYSDMTFVVAINSLEGHSNNGALWAFRDNGAGDSNNLKDLCGSGSLHVGREDAANRKHPTFTRAVAFLKRHHIKPLVWNGKEIEPL